MRWNSHSSTLKLFPPQKIQFPPSPRPQDSRFAHTSSKCSRGAPKIPENCKCNMQKCALELMCFHTKTLPAKNIREKLSNLFQFRCGAHMHPGGSSSRSHFSACDPPAHRNIMSPNGTSRPPSPCPLTVAAAGVAGKPASPKTPH